MAQTNRLDSKIPPFCIQEVYLNIKGNHHCMVKGQKEKLFQVSFPKKQSGIAILILTK